MSIIDSSGGNGVASLPRGGLYASRREKQRRARAAHGGRHDCSRARSASRRHAVRCRRARVVSHLHPPGAAHLAKAVRSSTTPRDGCSARVACSFPHPKRGAGSPALRERREKCCSPYRAHAVLGIPLSGRGHLRCPAVLATSSRPKSRGFRRRTEAPPPAARAHRVQRRGWTSPRPTDSKGARRQGCGLASA